MAYETITNRRSKTKARIVTLGIETRPLLAYSFGIWEQNIGQVKEFGSMFAFAAKFYDERQVKFYSDHHDGREAMVHAAWKILDDADIVVGYNSRGFDVKLMNLEFALLGLTPPSPYKQIDLRHVVKGNFRLVSNELDHVASQLGLGSKTKRAGFQLWLDCMNGDAKAWALMKKYNVQDVVLTEKLYDRLRPWVKQHPHLGTFEGSPDSCTNCGNKGPHEYTGLHRTLSQAYDRYRCRNCGAHLRSNSKSLTPRTTRQAA
jgi:hypothetical protein